MILNINFKWIEKKQKLLGKLLLQPQSKLSAMVNICCEKRMAWWSGEIRSFRSLYFPYFVLLLYWLWKKNIDPKETYLKKVISLQSSAIKTRSQKTNHSHKISNHVLVFSKVGVSLDVFLQQISAHRSTIKNISRNTVKLWG